MPEGVEIYLTAIWLNDLTKNHILTKLKTIRGKYTRKHIKNDPKHYNLDIIGVKNKGKLLYFEFVDENKNPLWLLVNFGLQGTFKLTKSKYTNQIFTIKNKNNNNTFDLYFDDLISYGTFRFVNTQHEFDKILNKLAPDFLQTDIDKKHFEAVLDKNKHKKIVVLLMDQTKLGSGIGNYLVSEILYDAKLNPNRTASSLSNKDIDNLIYSIQYVIKLAYQTENIGYIENFDPAHLKYIKKYRKTNHHILPNIKLNKNDETIFKVYKQKEDPNGNPIIKESIIPGRLTYYSPIQK